MKPMQIEDQYALGASATSDIPPQARRAFGNLCRMFRTPKMRHNLIKIPVIDIRLGTASFMTLIEVLLEVDCLLSFGVLDAVCSA